MALWNHGAVLKFIGLYREEHVLWDPNHPKFEHEMKSNRAWANIREDMGPPYKLEDLVLKMFSLQRMYHKHKLGNTTPPNYGSYNSFYPSSSNNTYEYFQKLDSFLGKTSTYITTANSTQVEKIKDLERVKVALEQKLRKTTKDLATAKDDVKRLTQQVANLQLENSTLTEKVQKIEDIERVKVALDQKLRDTIKDLATAKDDVKRLTQQVANLQLENNTPREEVQKIEDIEHVKVALVQKLRDKTKDLGTAKDDVKELTQQVANMQLENNTLREEVQKIGDTEDVKVALDQQLRDITKDLATTKDDVKELTQQVVNLQLVNNTPREEVQKIGDTEDVKVKDAGVPQQEDVCSLYGKLLVEKLRQLPERERHYQMLEIDGTFSRHFDVK